MMNEIDRIVFMHIPKTAGTSLNKTISQKFNSDEIINYYYHDGCYPALRKMTKGFFTGHFEYGLQDSVFDDSYKISFLRNPVDRLISQINFDHRFFLSEPKGYPKQLEIFNNCSDYKDFILKSKNTYFDNAQVRAFANLSDNVGFGEIKLCHFQQAVENLKIFDYIGFQEKFETCVKELASRLNITPEFCKENMAEENPWLNTNPSEDVVDLTFLRSLNCWDELLYQYAFNGR